MCPDILKRELVKVIDVEKKILIFVEFKRLLKVHVIMIFFLSFVVNNPQTLNLYFLLSVCLIYIHTVLSPGSDSTECKWRNRNACVACPSEPCYLVMMGAACYRTNNAFNFNINEGP